MKSTICFEYLRGAGIFLILFLGFFLTNNAEIRLRYFSFFIVLVMSGGTALEGIFCGRNSSEKIGYSHNREYQIQSAISNIAVTITAIICFSLHWGKYADATILIVSLLFFLLSGINHTYTALVLKNYKITNLLRFPLIIILILFLLPSIITALYS